MFTLEKVESIVGLMTIILAYFFVVTVSGYFRAWVAVKMGDETPEYMGFLSLSPFRHADPIGFTLLILFGFGWGRYIPIMPFNIVGRLRKIKLFIANFSDVFINLFIATVSLTGLVIYFGRFVLNISLSMMLLPQGDMLFFSLIKSINLIREHLVMLYPTSSSFAISMVLVTIAVMYLSVLLAVLNFIISGFGFLYTMLKDRMYFWGKYSNIFVVLIPMFLIFFFISPLRIFVALGIKYFVSVLVKLLGFY